MPRYIDAEVMPKDEFWEDLTDREKAKVLQWLISAPTADVAPRTEWISVEERLPDKRGQYLIYTSYGFIKCSWYEVLNKIRYFDNSTVTHWMPLPEPPKGE